MAKNKKSKILAMALCASVMTGIYAAPVMAGTIDVNTENGGLAVTINSDGNFPNDGIYLDKKDPGDLKITGMFSVSADQLAMAIKDTDVDVNSATANEVITNKISSKNGRFIEVGQVRIERGSWIGQSYFGNDVSLMDGNVTFKGLVNSDDKGAYITLKGHEGKTAELSYKQLANINGTIQDGNVVTAKELTVNGASGGLYVRDVVDGKTMIYTKAADDTNTVWIDPENGNISTIGTVGVTDDLESGKLITQIQGSGENIGDIAVGIQYDGAGNITGQNIVLDASTGDVIAKGTLSGTGLVAEGADGGLYVQDIGGETMIFAGPKGESSTLRIDPTNGNFMTKGTISVADENWNPITQIEGSGENIGDIAVGIKADGTQMIHLDASTGSITAADFNGVTLATNGDQVLVGGVDIAKDSANIGGISRQQDADGVFYTNIEGTLTVSEKGLAAITGDNAINLNEFGINLAAGNNVISMTDAGIGFAGTVYTGNASDLHFTYDGYTGAGGKGIAAGNYTLDDLVDKVADIYDRTQGITYENGTTTVDGNLNVKGDATTGEGGNLDAGSGTIGDVTMSDGNINTDGVINAGGGGTIGGATVDKDGNINTDGVINAGGGTIGDVTMSDGNINTDGVINAGGGTIGDVTMSDGNINTDGVINAAGGGTIGDVTISDGKVTTGQTTVSKDSVSIADKTIISDSDVVINEGTEDRVSLSETAGRVDNLEQGVAELNNRVGELEDRIDKVGAMAAAIANLRTMGYDPAAPTEVAVGIGQYRDETGAALGLFHYPNRDFMLSLSVSTSGDEVMGGIGATWKFGRKSPEKVAEIKKAQAEADARRAEEAKLAKAEEMKQAAKEAKIKAQQERHAKLAAERAAQAEAAK